VVAALLFYFVPALFSGGEPSPWLTPAFGLGAVLLARRPGGLVGLLADRWPRRLIVVRRDLPPTTAGLSTPAEAMADG
jgi:hypothetical protein